jgi:hypothetical protein|tara:strand:+ start:472 stop:729 length:258 start_codon:yes stop_codon:yes gene_type:complete
MAGNLNSGRKNKSNEIAMIEKLSPLDNEAFEQLKKGIARGEFAFIKLFFLYRWGKPKQIQEITVHSEQPLFDISQVPNILFKKSE